MGEFEKYLENGIDGTLENPLSNEKLLSMFYLWGLKAKPLQDEKEGSANIEAVNQDTSSLYKQVVLADLAHLARAAQKDDECMLIHFAHRLKGVASQDGDIVLEKWASDVENNRTKGEESYEEIIYFMYRVIEKLSFFHEL